ncbi:MAG: hypothetical protein E6G67_04345 [Actinobacteria bacterium]|nr:MAG: hypothetical protein E6G67_04345 [Actinomycetota bacterium]
MTMIRARLDPFFVLLLLAFPLAAAACGGGGSSSSSATTGSTSTGASSSGGTVVNLSADPSGALKFDKATLTAPAGTVTVVMTNPSSIPHAIAVEGNGVDKKGATVTSSGQSKLTLDLKPGTYEFYCPVDSHKAAGMKGELTVT